MPEPTDTPHDERTCPDCSRVIEETGGRYLPPPAPEPGADATLRLTGIVNIGYSDTDPGDMGEPRVFQSDGEWYVTVPSWAALARPTPALDVEALDIRWLLDNSNPMHYQGCEPDGCSCGVSAKYEAISDRQAVREELAARATEGGTDR